MPNSIQDLKVEEQKEEGNKQTREKFSLDQRQNLSAGYFDHFQ